MSLDALHEPLLPLLARLLHELSTHALSSLILDLGCGSGAKLPLLREAFPTARVVGLDRDWAALQRAGSAGYDALVAADAHQLPSIGQFDLIWCCATIGLLEHPAQALREALQALQPGGQLVLVTATQRWVLQTDWPAQLLAALSAALPQRWHLPVCGEECAAETAALLTAAGYTDTVVRTWPLDGEAAPECDDELHLADWVRLRPLVAERLAPGLLAECDAAAAAAEPAMVSLLIAALAARSRKRID